MALEEEGVSLQGVGSFLPGSRVRYVIRFGFSGTVPGTREALTEILLPE